MITGIQIAPHMIGFLTFSLRPHQKLLRSKRWARLALLSEESDCHLCAAPHTLKVLQQLLAPVAVATLEAEEPVLCFGVAGGRQTRPHQLKESLSPQLDC